MLWTIVRLVRYAKGDLSSVIHPAHPAKPFVCLVQLKQLFSHVSTLVEWSLAAVACIGAMGLARRARTRATAL